MLYEAKQGTKACEYIKSILDAEFEEHQAYMKRVEEAVGFKFEKYQGYQPNRTLTREYEITAIWVLSERYDTLDKKVWKKEIFDFSEALRRMKEGKKVRRVIWKECGAYIHIISETIVAVCDGNFFPCVFKDSEDILATDWEEVER